MSSTPLREYALRRVRQERLLQIAEYGPNDDLYLGFGGKMDGSWLTPFTSVSNETAEGVFRLDYEVYQDRHGNPTWMHLIREEVAELFAASEDQDIIDEAVQVAALCVSLVEHLIAEKGKADGTAD